MRKIVFYLSLGPIQERESQTYPEDAKDEEITRDYIEWLEQRTSSGWYEDK